MLFCLHDWLSYKKGKPSYSHFPFFFRLLNSSVSVIRIFFSCALFLVLTWVPELIAFFERNIQLYYSGSLVCTYGSWEWLITIPSSPRFFFVRTRLGMKSSNIHTCPRLNRKFQGDWTFCTLNGRQCASAHSSLIQGFSLSLQFNIRSDTVVTANAQRR